MPHVRPLCEHAWPFHTYADWRSGWTIEVHDIEGN